MSIKPSVLSGFCRMNIGDKPVREGRDYVNSSRNPTDRPVSALSVLLLPTFKAINEVFYADKRRRRAMALSAEKQLESASLSASPSGQSNAIVPELHNDGFDDDQGNFLVQVGEEIANRYVVREILGKGSFGIVLKAYDQRRDEYVAVKVIRNRPQFKTQGRLEIDILMKLSDALNSLGPNQVGNSGDVSNPDAAKKVSDAQLPVNHMLSLNSIGLSSGGIVKLRKYFSWRDHLCLVFELLSYSLYDLIKFTKFQGLSLNIVRKVAIQLLHTLHFLRVAIPNNAVLHCDIKPENILLVNSKRSAVKLIDFGSSCYGSRCLFRYIQSRFYRSPEVLLNLPYGPAIDMWSLGCVLCELHTGIPLFDGKNEMDQLAKIESLLGAMPEPMILASPKRDTFYTLQALSRPQQNGMEDVHEDEKDAQSSNGKDQTVSGHARYMLQSTVGECEEAAVRDVIQKAQEGNCAHEPQQQASQLNETNSTKRSAPPQRYKPRTFEAVLERSRVRRGGRAGHTEEDYRAFTELLISMLRYDPTERVNPEEALRSPFLCPS